MSKRNARVDDSRFARGIINFPSKRKNAGSNLQELLSAEHASEDDVKQAVNNNNEWCQGGALFAAYCSNVQASSAVRRASDDDTNIRRRDNDEDEDVELEPSESNRVVGGVAPARDVDIADGKDAANAKVL